MLYALTAEEMRAAEERAAAAGLSIAALMERAGTAVAADAAAGAPVGTIVVACGKGNNGGDGWVAARELHAAGRDVRVLALAAPGELASPAREAAEAAISLGVGWTRPDSDAVLVEALAGASLIVDAVFGFGFHPPAREPYARALEAIDDAEAAVLAVDMPSGVDPDTGAVSGPAVHADVTLTFTAPKIGLVVYPGAEYAGEVRVADIGVPRQAVDEVGRVELLDDEDFLELFPFTRPDAHKNSRGRLLVVAGSRGMTGAAAMAADAALRLGVGYVTLACADSLVETLAAKLTPVVIRPLPEAVPGVLAPHAAEEVFRLAAGADCVLAGPGLTAAEGPSAVARRLVAELAMPLVVDADALNAFAGDPEPLRARTAATILTPHPGELSRLLGVPAEEIQSDRLAFGARLAGESVACVLKGARTVITGEGRQSIETAGNSGMATAGSGDVLAGMLGALLAKGLSPYDAATLGVHLHARAGDLAAVALTPECVTATDILRSVPDAVAELLGR
ncbi:MAG TPA: NAD(P)H-hydrate dehydratase [Coriobacteriia bacterium]|jgi:NAD(P)H-hydrate epimerase